MIRFVLCLLPALLLGPALAADPRISEFLASNASGLADADGTRADWIEIHNPAATPVNLGGWYLTDNASNRTKWRFPSVTIPPRGYLVVYASNKDRRIPGEELHTNFALSAGGEFLALVKPDGVTLASAFAPSFPPQAADISYGFPENIETRVLVAEDAACRWIVPTSATNPASGWRDPAFDDSDWNPAFLGIGYDRNTSGVNYLPEIGAGGNTEAAMFQAQASCYVRIPFELEAVATFSSLTLRLKFEDGFAAWLNGEPLLAGGAPLRRNAPANLAWNSIASGENLDVDAIAGETFDISDSLGSLVEGENVLTFHVLNRSLGSSDLLLRPELVATTASAGAPLPPAYFATPTPGAPNPGPGGTILPRSVVFSRPEGTFDSPFFLTLGGAGAGEEIRYTLDGSLPGPASAFYSGPIPIGDTTAVRARVIDPEGGAAGFVGAALYERLASSLADYGPTGQPFRSALPILIINNRGAGEPINNDQYSTSRIHVIDRDASGYASIAAAPSLSIGAGVKIRGSSSATFSKKSYAIEFRDESGEGISAPLLGMPSGEDWALISCQHFDPSFMRNAWVHELYRQTGRWAPRTRFVEVFFNFNGNNLSFTQSGQSDYRGVYLLCETVRRGGERVDVTKLETADVSPPGITGGYILKVDRADPDEFWWKTERSLPVTDSFPAGLIIHRPKLPDLAPQQSAYLVDYFQDFEDALWADAAGGFATRDYLRYIEPVSWIDHNLFNMFAKNVDALRLSAYFQKDRGRRIAGGPLWDFDRSADSTDGRDNAFDTWRGTGDATDYFGYSWWGPLFQDPDFRQAYVDRWQEHRRGPLATANIQALLDGFLAEFRTGDADHPTLREYARWWGGATARDLDNETNHLKTWLSNRAAWIDSQFCPPPVLSDAGGPVSAGETVSLSVPAGTTVYYTLDGSDPRASGGGLAATAITHAGGPIAIDETTVVTARARRPGSFFNAPATAWSGPVTGLFLVEESYASAANLRIGGIHYHPLGPDAAELAALPELDASDFEWIELLNASDGPVNLEGVMFEEGSPVSALTLPPFTLQPGERALVVKNREAFLLRHPQAGGRIVAEWMGDKRLANSGETIRVLDAQGGTIASFDYRDGGGWPALADGSGSALVYLGTGGSTADYEDPSNWQASAAIDGTPGFGESGTRPGVVINEILAASELPQLDTIELVNRSDEPVDISGWFLSDSASPLTPGDLRKFRVPDGTVLPPGGWVAFSEADFNPAGEWNPDSGEALDEHFPLDGHRGGTVRLVSADPATGALFRSEDVVAFPPSLAGVPFGRWPDGADLLLPLASLTPAAANAGPRVGPIQVSEILYHPDLAGVEFIEIVNTGSSPESLADWTLRGDVDYFFAPDDSLEPGASLVLVPFDPAASPGVATAFREIHGVPESTALFGPWAADASLGNTSGTVSLRRPVPPPPEEPAFVGRMIEDETRYLAVPPWPTGISGTGRSIHRLGIHRWAGDPAAWTSAAASPGRDAGGFAGWQRQHFADADPLAGALDDFDGDGLPNLLEYALGRDPRHPEAAAASAAVERDGGDAWLILDYLRRRDRDDISLEAWESPDLENWQPAADDALLEIDGLIERRRARLPIGEGGGYLRLRAAAP